MSKKRKKTSAKNNLSSKGSEVKINEEKAEEEKAGKAGDVKAEKTGDVKAGKAGNAVQEPELKLGFYTGTVLVAVIVSAINAMLAFVLTARPDFYYVSSKIGASFGENKDLYVEMFRGIIFGDSELDKITTKLYIAAILAVLAAVLFIVSTARVANPAKKPAVAVTVLAFLFCVGALVFCILARGYAEDCFSAASERYEMAVKHSYTIYDYSFISGIANTVTAFFAVIGTFYSRSRYNREGKAY